MKADGRGTGCAMISVMSNPKGSLASVLVRIERAKAHLVEFERQARPIVAACKVTKERDDRRSEYVFRISRPAIPPELSAVIGDAIHNLRVSLDYLAWQLVIATGKKRPIGGPGGTHFPIHDGRRPDLPYIAPGVARTVQVLLDEVQPYQRPKPKSHDLAILRDLDNSDKHHDLLVTVVSANTMAYWADAASPSGQFNVGPYADGDVICRFSYSGTNDDFAPMVMFDVRLGESDAGYKGEAFGAADLVRLPLRYIENDVLPRFRGFLH